MFVKILQILFLVLVLIVVLGNISGILLKRIYFRWNKKIIKLYQQGNYDAAIPLAQKAVELAKERWNDKHPNVAISLNQLGLLYYSQGKYAEAKSCGIEAWKIARIALRKTHPEIVTALNNLGGLSESQGKSQSKYTEVESENYPDFATSLNYNLGLLYYSQDRYAELEQLTQELQLYTSETATTENSDTWEEVSQQVMELYQQGNYSAAIPLAQKAVELARQRWGNQHPNVATSLNNLASLYDSQGRYSEAEPRYKEAIAIDRIALPENHPDLAIDLSNLAELYRSQGRYSEAEPLYNEAIAIDRIALPPNHPQLANHLNNLAVLYESQGRYSEAEPLYQEAITIVRIALPENHSQLATHLNNLAELYRSQGRYSEAEPLLDEAIDIDRIALPKNHPSLATHLNNLALLYSSQGRYSEAEHLHKEAIAIVRIALPENHPYLASSLNNLANLYQSQGRYSEAEPLYNEAIAIDRITLPENHPQLATGLNNLAELYRFQGRYSEAERLYDEAIAIVRIALPENHPSLASSLNNLALLYESQGRYSEAERLYDEAIAIDRIVLPKNHPDLATHLNNLALLYKSQGRYSEAEPLFKEAIAIDRIALPKNHPSLATDLSNQAELYRYQGRYSEAERLYDEAIAIDRIALPENHPDLARDLSNLAALYDSQGRYSEAEPLYDEAIAIGRIALPENHPSLATYLSNLAALYESQGRYSEAERLYNEAIAIDRIALPENHPHLATHLNNLANLYESQGRYSEAEPLYQDAIAIDRIALPENHPQLARYLSNLAALYCSQGRYSEAEPLYNEEIAIVRMALPENHPDLATHLNNLASLYCSQGRYSEAEPLYNEAIAIDRIALPKNHPSLATDLSNLAELYRSQRRYSEAEPLYDEAIAIVRIALPKNHPNLATHLNNRAELYRSQGRYSEAEPLLDEAIDIDRIALPKNHPSLATHLNNLALLYSSQGRYSEAEHLHNEAIAIDRIALPENHPQLISHLNNLAFLYSSQGRYSEAFEQLQASLKSENLRLRYIFSTSSDRERREYLQKNPETYYAFLTLVWQHLRDDPQAVGAALDAVLGRKALTTAALAAQNAAIYSGRYSEAIQNIFRDLQQCNEEILEATYAPPPKPEPSPEAYEQQRKERRQRLANLQKKSEDLEKQLAKEIPELQLSQQKVNRDLVAAQLPDGSALVEFVRFKHYDFGAPKGEKWQEDRYLAFVVMAHQPEQVRLVDLGEAEPLDKLIKTFRSYFVSAGDTFARHKSESIAKKALKQLEVEQKQLEVKRQLYQTLCQPLIEALPSVFHCFLAPDSTLNILPFQILPLDTDSYLGDKYRISYLNSGRDLLRQEIRERPLKICPATILADPDYDWHGTDGRGNAPVLAPEQGSGGAGEVGAIPPWLPRSEGAGEVGAIPPWLPRSGGAGEKGENLTLSAISGFGRAYGTDIFGIRAGELLGVEPYLRENAISRHLTHGDCPCVLAVATHGFYHTAEKPYFELIVELFNTEPGTETQLFKQNAALMNGQLLNKLEQVAQYCETEYPQYVQPLRDLAPKIQDYIDKQPIASRLDAADPNSPMYRGGIVLAGANVWNQGGTLPNGNKGILFAQDVAALDLWGNELSALIACQTGLGEVASGDTVGGLRRAFVVSGSKTQVMSLWSVPARATCYLMERFFHHLNAGLGRAEALARAQFEVRTVTAGTLRQSDLGREILQELTWDYKDEDCPLSDPYYWGAWVLQGDISPLAVKLYGDMV